MDVIPAHAVAVIFSSTRNGRDAAGYAAAAEEMDRRAAAMPGYLGIEATRGADGFGITVSYWASEADAIAWRDDPDHRAARDAGRDRWYDSYRITVATITRGYAWTRTA